MYREFDSPRSHLLISLDVFINLRIILIRMPRKKERESKLKRLLKIMREDPVPAPILAKRFGMHATYIRKLARQNGIKLPSMRDFV